MDWPRQTFLSQNGLDGFTYCMPSNGKCSVLYYFDDSEGPRRIDLVGEKDWVDFDNLPIFKNSRGQPVNSISALPTGICILFCPRSRLDDEGGESGDEADLSDICLKPTQWQSIASRFHLHSFLIDAIKQRTTTTTSAIKTIEKLNSDETLEGHKDSGEAENLWMLTAMTSAEFKNNFALSATYFDKKHLTFVVVLGATDEQVKRVEELLGNAEDAIGHPFIMLGLCAELLLRRLRDMVDDVVDECMKTTRSMKLHALAIRNVPSRNQVVPEVVLFVERVHRNRRKSQQVEEEVKLTKAYLSKELPEKQALDADPEDDQLIEVTERIYHRFDYIFLEMDALMNKSRIFADEMSFTADTIRGEISRREASSGARLAGASVVIAAVVAFYVPATSVATIFAMPVFDFKNDWRDWRYHPVQAPSGHDNSSTGSYNTAEHVPVFSGYFWAYAGISTGLMIFTICACWVLFSGVSEDDPNRLVRHFSAPVEAIFSPQNWTYLALWVKGLVSKTKPPPARAQTLTTQYLEGYGKEREDSTKVMVHSELEQPPGDTRPTHKEMEPGDATNMV